MNKIKTFIKKYGYYCLAGLVVVALGVTIALSAGSSTTTSNINSAQNPVISVGSKPAQPVITFTLPMDNPSVVKDYSSSDLMWNETLAWWEAHEGVDLTSASTKVYSIADGEVLSVTEDTLEGVKIVISHDNGLQSVYSSLAQNANVAVGDKVKKGEHIGDASTTAGNEAGTGAHLHLELVENNKKIDPNNYLSLGNK